MAEESFWWNILAGRWMFPFYGGLLILLGLRLENHRRARKLDKGIERILNNTFINRDIALSDQTLKARSLELLTNQLKKIEQTKGFAILSTEKQSIEFEYGIMEGLFSKNPMLLRKIFNDNLKGEIKKRIKISGSTLLLKKLQAELILVIFQVDTKFPLGNVKR